MTISISCRATTLERLGTSAMTTAPVPTKTSSPRVTAPRMEAPAPRKTRSPMRGISSGRLAEVPPRVTLCRRVAPADPGAVADDDAGAVGDAQARADVGGRGDVDAGEEERQTGDQRPGDWDAPLLNQWAMLAEVNVEVALRLFEFADPLAEVG